MAQTSYQTIVHFNTALADELTGGILFGLQSFPSSIVISTNDALNELGRLLAVAQHGVALVFGIDDSDEGNKKFTVSFLALDEKKQILCAHIKNTLDGEESWPSQSVLNFPETVEKLDPGKCL